MGPSGIGLLCSLLLACLHVNLLQYFHFHIKLLRSCIWHGFLSYLFSVYTVVIEYALDGRTCGLTGALYCNIVLEAAMFPKGQDIWELVLANRTLVTVELLTWLSSVCL